MTLDLSKQQLTKLEINGLTLKTYLKNWPGEEYSLEGVTCLKCRKNNLTELPELPETLEELDCSGNHINVLPKLPKSLKILDCSENNLQSLPELPLRLNVLDCKLNQLVSLPKLPDSLGTLDCFHNQLEYLPLLPESVEELWCHRNPSLLFVSPISKKPPYLLVPQQLKHLFEDGYDLYYQKYQTYRYLISHLVLVSNILPSIISNDLWWFPVNI